LSSKEHSLSLTIVPKLSIRVWAVRVIKAKGIAFVTYKMRASAEFAKEAMAEQVDKEAAILYVSHH
jgi:hypothetical protein